MLQKNIRKCFLFVFIFFLFFLYSGKSFAVDTVPCDGDRQNCISSPECLADQKEIGLCKETYGRNKANKTCCESKDDPPDDNDPKDKLTQACELPPSEGGKGGRCQSKCSGKDEVAYGKCSEKSSARGTRQDDCCVSKDSIPDPVNASFDYTPLEPIPGIDPEDSKSFESFIESIYIFALWSVGIASLFMLTIGGFWYMTSAGNTSRIGEAKKIIASALVGLLIALITWLILYVLNPDLVRINIDLTNFQVRSGYDGGDDWDGDPIDGGGVIGTGDCSGYKLSGPTCVLLSEALQTFLTCVRKAVPSNVPITITSITSNGLVKSEDDLEASKLCCGHRTKPCPHGSNSCHHGCKTTNPGYSYAVDFAMSASNPNYCTIAEAAENCGAREKLGPKTTGADCGNIKAYPGHSGHFHFSAGCP